MMTDDESRERRETEPRPPIRKGYTKITSWDEVDFTLPIVQERMFAAYHYMYSVKQEQEIAQLDLAARPLPWIKQPDKLIWTCDQPPHRGTVQIPDGGFAWQSCIESPHAFKVYSRLVPTLDAALSWTEHFLTHTVANGDSAQAPVPATPPSAPPLSLATLTPAHRKRLKRFWIDPRTLEPAYVTYQPELYVGHAPTMRKHMELSFGETLHYDERYPTALQLAQELCLDGKQVDIATYGGDFFHITSLTTYADAAIAGAQVNQLWEHGAIAASCRAQRIKWAVAGLKEVETGYFKVIALCGEPSIRPQERDQYMAAKAFGLTLIHALDVDGYAAANPWEAKRLSREELLEQLHYQRQKSRYLSPAVRAESEAWLHTHGQSDSRPYVQPIVRKLEVE